MFNKVELFVIALKIAEFVPSCVPLKKESPVGLVKQKNTELIFWGELFLSANVQKRICHAFFERAQHSVRSASREISSAAWSREPEMLIMVIDNAGIWWLFMVGSVQPHSSAH